ncbi:unknown [Clostridium sp. CAG:921]|nr:unknown [Clostridium sp. CAG:921]
MVDAINSIKSSEKKSNYELINCYKKLRDLYNNLVENATWQKVEDMSILQPETSFNDDVYVLLIRQKENGNVLKDDMQVLTCKRQEDSGVQELKNVREVEKAVKLPVTGENIVLIGGFLAVVVAIVMTLIVKKKLNKEAK